MTLDASSEPMYFVIAQASPIVCLVTGSVAMAVGILLFVMARFWFRLNDAVVRRGITLRGSRLGSAMLGIFFLNFGLMMILNGYFKVVSADFVTGCLGITFLLGFVVVNVESIIRWLPRLRLLMNPELPPLVLLAPRMTEDSKAIWQICTDWGWRTERIQGWRVPPEWVDSERRILIYGEPLFAEAVADQLGLVLLEPSIDWLVKIPCEHRLREIELMSLGEARTLTMEAFVKPADGKIFEPRVYGTGADLPGEESVDLDTPVLRSEIVDFQLEVRCFVRGRSIVTLSPYWRGGALALDDEGFWPFQEGEESDALHFAGTVLEDSRVALPPACTLDVGKLADGRWAVIEANPCWGAGLYGCDPGEVLLAIGAAIVRSEEVDDSQRPWVSQRRIGLRDNPAIESSS